MSSILVQAKPDEKREVLLGSLCHDGPEVCISVNDFKALCDLFTKQMQYILTKTKDEDQKIIKKRGDDLKDATQNLENFHRQVPLWSQLNWKMKRLLRFYNWYNSLRK